MTLPKPAREDPEPWFHMGGFLRSATDLPFTYMQYRPRTQEQFEQPGEPK
jgi:hypothetical protein